MNDRLLPPHRRPVVIADSQIRAGGASAHVHDHDPELLLRRYLRLIRRARNQQRHRTIALRRADVEALADHLGWTEDAVITRLAELMGTTRRQRARMLALLATGASLITVAGPTAVNAAGTSGEWQQVALDDTPVVIIADHLSLGPRPGAEHAARIALPDEPIAKPNTSHPDRPVRHAPVLEAQHRRGATPVATARVERPRLPESTASLPNAAPTHVDSEPGPSTEPAVPLDADLDTAQFEIGSEPDPVAEPPATDLDGNHVAVGEPPIPPPVSLTDETVVEPPIEP